MMRAVGISKMTVWRWQDYFVEAGVGGLVKGRSKPPGRKPIADDLKLRVVEKTVKERPLNATHCRVRSIPRHFSAGIKSTGREREPPAPTTEPYSAAVAVRRSTRSFKEERAGASAAVGLIRNHAA
jgi:hypothetical protein